MKPFLIAAALAAVAAITATTPALAADVGVSVSIGQPGFYGQIDIGDFPRPQLMYPQPMIIERHDRYGPPIYMRVPPGHAKNWSRHCREYNACGEQVYFVEDNWYNHEYVPRYQQQHQNWQKDIRNERGDEHGNSQHGGNENQHQGNDNSHGKDKHDNGHGH